MLGNSFCIVIQYSQLLLKETEYEKRKKMITSLFIIRGKLIYMRTWIHCSRVSA